MHNPPTKHNVNKGQLLLADPSLNDQLFKKSVILLAEYHLDKGAMGLILNHPTHQKVGDILATDEFSKLKNIRVHVGGPVNQQNLIFAAFWQQKNSQLGYATRITAEDASKRIHQPGTLDCAFAGHSSWTPGQLEDEMENNSWITSEPTPQLLANEHERSLWAKILRSMSPYHQILAEAPDDIFVN